MCLVTSKCVPKYNGFGLPYLAFLILSFLNCIVSLFLFLPFLTFLSEFVFLSPSPFPPFLFFPYAFVLPVPTALL